LDAISNLIEKRKQQLNKFDVLVKSRFIEMFGATDRFEEVPLHDSVEEMHIGPFGSSLKNECFVEVDQSYCMVYEQKHAIRKTMDVDTRYVDEKKYKELRRFTVQGGDIIVSCRGTIGETFIIPEDAPFGIMHPSIMKIRVKPNEYNRVFFNHLLQNVLERHEAAANGSGVKMAVTATALGKERFIKPPMKLQLEYSDFVAQVDKSKLAVQKSLEQLEILKKALMQEYFG
ncbi:MAG: restriction endonuclease subunit S, partial [Porphyromonadaceae bacterium]|nr:restriction endonuclease subunit S [Porphyromonadaceae bacterium]